MNNLNDTLKICGTCGNPVRRIPMLTSVIDHCDFCENKKLQNKKSPPTVIYLGDDGADEEDYLANNGLMSELDFMDLLDPKKNSGGI